MVSSEGQNEITKEIALTNNKKREAKMKLHKSILTTVTVMLALAQNVNAQFAGTSTQFSKLTVGLTVQTNKDQIEAGTAIIDSIGRARLDNKALLQMFATWSGNSLTNWQAQGAQWIFDWDTYQPAIADRTGTNILLYTGSDGGGVVSGTMSSSFDIDWFRDFGPFSRKFLTTNPGSDTFTDDFDLGYFRLAHSNSADESDVVDIAATGPKVEHYTQTWDVNHSYLKWTDSEQFKPAGSGEIIGTDHFAAVSGQINAKGSGDGRNFYIYNP